MTGGAVRPPPVGFSTSNGTLLDGTYAHYLTRPEKIYTMVVCKLHVCLY
ncbi:MAG: hypothetical protein QOI57_1237 [Rubrobacteraceae bacterium]|jgi:hypothetical protein|nr:hypothetical protein [Rubrobacteraceae bacterium]